MNQVLADKTETTDDWLLGGRVRLRQSDGGYRVAIDPILLAAAVPARAGDTVLDLGCGTGAAALCLHHRVAGCHIVGLEKDSAMIALARANALLNGAVSNVSFEQGDVANMPPQLAAGGFDHVVSNPPFLQPERADRRFADNRQQAMAYIEGAVKLCDWIAAMASALKPKGRMTLIHRADRVDELLAELRRHAGNIVVFPLWPKVGREAKRILVTARVGVATPTRISPGLILHQDDGGYSTAARDVLENASPLII